MYFLPNQYQITKRYEGAIISDDSLNTKTFRNNILVWQPNLIWALYISLSFIISVIFMSKGIVEFIYFDF